MDKEELTYLSGVRAHIGEELARLQSEQRDTKRQIREENRAFLAENPFAAVYGRAETLRRENEARCLSIEELELKKQTLLKMMDAPYFGRVDFLYDGETEPERFYIGIATLTDFSTGEILVNDWRAPVSALFYYGEKGPASYKAPCGTLTGEILRIRQYRFSAGELRAAWDADLQIDDSVLREALSGSAAEKMKPIVCTIQREQNRAIRFHPKKDLAVFGPAGCGKTSIGMHRLSWLLYQLRAEGYVPALCTFTANEAFRSYISGVLPELGELNVDASSFPELFDRCLPGYQVESALRQTETLLAEKPAREAAIRQVYDPAFLAYAAASVSKTRVFFRSVALYGEVILPAEALENRLAALPARVPVRRRLQTVADWAHEEISNYFLIHKRELLNRIFNDMEAGDSSAELYRRLKEKTLSKTRQMVLGAASESPEILYPALFEDYFGTSAAALRERIACRVLRFEDAVVMLYLKALLGGCEVRRKPDHILIDEAQDFAPVQHRILRTIYPKAVFTLLADVNQGIAPALNTSEAALTEIYGAAALRINKSYRATRQLCEYAKRFLPPDAADYEAFDRDGPPPFLHKSADPVRTAAEIIRARPAGGSLCVILKTTDRAAEFGKALKAMIPECVRVTSDKKTLAGSVYCMPAALTKGLEFDTVILPMDEPPEENPRLSYLTATRALHELHLIFPPDAYPLYRE